MLALSFTPLHPQWFSFRAKTRAAGLVADAGACDFLDIGCADGPLRRRLAGRCRYVGLDYPPTGHELYGARPEVFGDAARLPFRASTFDAVALLDVLEHLAEPQASLREIARVLRPGGVLYINVPCMYPLHDEPHDYQRPTVHGLRHWLQLAGFRVEKIEPRGVPPETAALILNIALTRMVTRAIQAFAPAAALIVLLAPLIPIVNLAGWSLGRLDRNDGLMPFAYWAIAHRASESEAVRDS
jgi:SAM-dependent methyltransferase